MIALPPPPPAISAPAPERSVGTTDQVRVAAALTDARVRVDSSFRGASIVLYGAVFNPGDRPADVVVVVRFQGPRANGMPELHKLTPPLGVLQDRGFKVALVTDGRMSGASGKVPAAIHCTPEALGGGPLARLRDGDVVKVCAATGELSTSADLASREPAADPRAELGTGRELFGMFRHFADGAEQGASAMLATGGM